MEMPRVKNPIKDPATGVTYVVMAYRQLSVAEMTMAVRVYRQQHKKAPARNSTVIIISVIGSNGM